MITTREVDRVAAETGFRSDVVEKVLRLHGILRRLDGHPMTRQAWLLKGGTALNLFHMDVPRLSVDIDLNYLGAENVEQMRQARPDFERALSACCEREGCTIRRAPTEHAGGKFRLRYASVVGGSQNLEVDVSYVAREPIWGSCASRRGFPPDPLWKFRPSRSKSWRRGSSRRWSSAPPHATPSTPRDCWTSCPT